MQTVSRAYLSEHPLPDHREATDKHQRGRVVIVAGSSEIPGAAYLASLAALRAGAGVIQIATCATAAPVIRLAMPEARVVACEETAAGGIDPSAWKRIAELAEGCDALLLGPGMVDDAAIAELVIAVLNNTSQSKIVLDAEAFVQLRSLSAELCRQPPGRVVVTPHSGEMAKFLGIPRDKVDQEPLVIAEWASNITGALVVLKGAATHIVHRSGQRWLSDHGCIGLATSGSGDTLAGILAGLLARGVDPRDAACWSVYLHAEAGQRLTKTTGAVGFLAREIPDHIPRIMEEFSTGSTIDPYKPKAPR